VRGQGERVDRQQLPARQVLGVDLQAVLAHLLGHVHGAVGVVHDLVDDRVRLPPLGVHGDRQIDDLH
jgi:hypothetical protein